MDEIEFKTVSVAGISKEDDGIVNAIVSVTGVVDRVGDIIEPGAYQKTLAQRTPKGVWHHSWTEPVAKTKEIKELMPGDPSLPDKLPNGDPWPKEAGALAVKMQFNLNGARGKQAYADVLFFDDEQEWSIGYNVPTGGAQVEQKSGIRRIKHLDLYEYSPVLFGAMPSARTQGGVKAVQLAFKSLGGAQFQKDDEPQGEGELEVAENGTDPDLDEDQLSEDLQNAIDGLDDDDEDDYEDEEEDDEEKSIFKDLFTKDVDPNKLRKAIAALEDLLDDIDPEGADDDSYDDEEKSTPIAFLELKAMDYDTSSELANSQGLADSTDLNRATRRFDAAVMRKELGDMQDEAENILDVLEQMSDEDHDGEKADAIGIMGSYIGSVLGSFENMPGGADGLKKAEVKLLPVRDRRAAYLDTMRDSDLRELKSYLDSVRGNTGMKSSVETEMSSRALLIEGRAESKAGKNMKTKKKVNVSPQRRDDAKGKGQSMPDGSFPIQNQADLKNAISAVGRAKDPEAAKKFIMKRAKQMGMEDMLPESWETGKDDDSDGDEEKSLIPLADFENMGIDVKSLLG